VTTVDPPRPLPDRPTIIVLRALPGLGDWLCAVPTLRALRRARPGATVHLVGHGPTRDLVGRYRGYVDVFHALPGWPGLPERRPAVRELPRFLSDLQELQADLAIQLHGSGEGTNDLIELFGARQVAGFYRPGQRCPDPARFLRWHDEDPEVRRGLRLLGLLGLPADDERLHFPLDPAGADRAAALLRDHDVHERYVVVHPGCTRPAGRWSVSGFAEAASDLERRGRRIVITGGPAERSLTAALARAVPGAVDLGGRTELDALGWLLRGADLLVANDTGVAHLAAALDVPSVVVFPSGPGSQAHRMRWASLDADRQRAVPPSVRSVVAEASRALRARERVA
jgi:ADP-heptose:LPS heptosyltransferase